MQIVYKNVNKNGVILDCRIVKKNIGSIFKILCRTHGLLQENNPLHPV
jgi:hypothetical protein